MPCVRRSCACAGIRVLFEMAVEGAYLNGPPVHGEEMVFQRTRVRINCPDAPPGEEDDARLATTTIKAPTLWVPIPSVPHTCP